MFGRNSWNNFLLELLKGFHVSFLEELPGIPCGTARATSGGIPEKVPGKPHGVPGVTSTEISGGSLEEISSRASGIVLGFSRTSC